MDALRKVNRLRKSILIFAALLFCFLLILNCLTPYVADDYVYRLCFHGDRHPVQSVGDVVRSMVVHSYAMNGRVVSHFFGQLFMIWPKMVFNVVNAAVFVLLVLLLHRIAGFGGHRSLLLCMGIAMALWRFMPVFGQVALWQLGSVNYLWGLLVGFVFLTPFIYRFLHGRELLPKLWQRILFCVFALPAGMYIEVMSFISFFLAAVLLVLARLMEKQSLKTWLLIPWGVSGAGYVLLMSMPAEIAAKQSAMNLESLLANFVNATNMLETYGLALLVVWVVLFLLGLYGKLSRERLALSAVFALGSVAANYMHTVARYYEARGASAFVTLLILACALLAAELAAGQYRHICACGCGVLAVVFTFSLITGAYSIWRSHVDFSARETVIAQSIADGETELTLAIVHPTTPYSAFWGLLDLNTELRDTWPNKQMAKYYGVDSILGY